MTYHTIGELYEETKNLSLKELTKKIRTTARQKQKEFNATMAATDPTKAVEISVRMGKGYRSIDVRIEAGEFWRNLKSEVNQQEFELNLGWSGSNSWERWSKDVWTPEMRQLYPLIELQKELQEVLDQHNFDNSDSQIDYFHTRFYGWAKIDY